VQVEGREESDVGRKDFETALARKCLFNSSGKWDKVRHHTHHTHNTHTHRDHIDAPLSDCGRDSFHHNYRHRGGGHGSLLKPEA
jgi:hypothetical protein